MKHNLKNCIKLGVIIFAIMVLIPCGVYATNNENQISDDVDAKCSNSLFYKDSEKKITVFSIKEDGDYYNLKFKVKKGTWSVMIFYGVDLDFSNVFTTKKNYKDKANVSVDVINDNEYVDGVYVGKQSFRFEKIEVTNQQHTFHIKKEDYEQLELYAIAELKEETEEGCKKGSVTLNGDTAKVELTGSSSIYHSTLKQRITRESYSSSRTGNSGVKEQCDLMTQGKYDKNPSSRDIPDEGDNIKKFNEMMSSSFPFCYENGSSDFDYSATDIEKVRHNAVDAYRNYLSVIAAQANNAEYTAAEAEIADQANGYVGLDTTTNNFSNDMISYNSSDRRTTLKTLKCATNQIEENTERFYVRVTETPSTNTMCTVTCQEQLQVTYDPPVASKAGLCFQYKVSVRSRVTCKTEIHGNIKWPTPPSACSYIPICSNNASETQAGPNEDFDSCVQECDGGKYSQSCINKCYKKVYENKNSKSKTKKTTTGNSENKNSSSLVLKNNSSTDLLQKLSNGDPFQDSKCAYPAIVSNLDYCVNFYYQVKQANPSGYFESIGSGRYQWYPCFDSSKCHISYSIAGTNNSSGVENIAESVKRAAPYYFRNLTVTRKTLQSFWGAANGVNGYGKPRKYNIDNNGIKRQWSSSYKCNETCSYYSGGNSGDNCVSSASEAANQIAIEFSRINTDLSQCTSKAECKEGTTYFTINLDQSEDSDDNWSAQNQTSSNEQCIRPGGNDVQMFIPLQNSLDPNYDDSIINDAQSCNLNPNGINGICYGRGLNYKWRHYKTTITFPGTWINLKTGGRVYHQNQYDSSIMREKPNYYCVGYDKENVNEKWWDWKINKIGNPNNIKVKYNIFATFKDFGKYNWSFDKGSAVQCFYAISNKVTTNCTTGEDNCCIGKDCCNGDECNTTIDNVRIRPVDQAELFAGRTGNQIGFNWTSAATDNFAGNKSGYNIDPGVYAKELKQIAKSNPESVYSGPTDYSIHLTKDNIKNIRNYVKQKGYTAYESNIYNKVEDVEGLYYYTSKILRDKDYAFKFDDTNANLGKNND